MEMRTSRVLRKLRAGEVVNCFKLNTMDFAPVEIAGMCGFDCIWICNEHIPNDWVTMKSQILAAKVYDVDTLVRVERGCYSDYIKPLEIDATGLMVPHVMSKADAESVARMTRFHPVGRRPIDGGNQDGAYCMIPMEEYVEQANRERFVFIQVEDPEPMEELEEICEVPGIDMIFFGPGDFSHGCGILGQWDSPIIKDARKRIAETARKHGKFAGTTGSVETTPELVDMGYQFINIGADVIGLGTYCKGLIEGWRKAIGT